MNMNDAATPMVTHTHTQNHVHDSGSGGGTIMLGDLIILISRVFKFNFRTIKHLKVHTWFHLSSVKSCRNGTPTYGQQCNLLTGIKKGLSPTLIGFVLNR